MGRLLRLLVISLLSLFLLAPAAGAQTRLYGEGHRPWMDRCLKRSLVPTPDTSIEVRHSEVYGLSYASPWPGGRIGLADLRASSSACRVLIHEVGHLFDWSVLSPSDRTRIACSIFASRQPVRWWSVSEDRYFLEDQGRTYGPLEWFAEAYTLAATFKDLPRGRHWSYLMPDGVTLGYGIEDVLDRGKLRRLRSLIFAAHKTRPADRSERDQRLPLACR